MAKKCDKRRELMRRHGDGDPKPVKGLSQTFEAIPVDSDDEEELVPDRTEEEQAPMHSPAAAPQPQQTGDEAYWMRLSMMFKENNKEQENILTDKLMAMKVAIDEETTSKLTKIESKMDTTIDEVKKSVASVTDKLTEREARQ